ncbi:MAG: tagaturonate reductase [Verrucomicrobia bacterium]|nr:tagaturonate reductase [Verrucomicrobiota bacterium]
MQRINKALLQSGGVSRDLHPGTLPARRETILQFGEGGFLRGFFDWMIHLLQQRGLYDGSIVVAQPIAHGMVAELQKQDGLYTVILRGINEGRAVDERTLISSVSRGIDPYTAHGEWLRCAGSPDLRFIVSNTTESGIACSPDDRLEDAPPVSFPAKLARFLYERFRVFGSGAGKGVVHLPCELIESNGTKLKTCVLETAARWRLESGFIRWLEEENVFCNTLVDRIVTGFPGTEAAALWEQLGYEDQLLDAGEWFHSWVIEGPAWIGRELPFEAAGLNVVFTSDYLPYRNRKVQILNGAHSALVCHALPRGIETVRGCMEHPEVRPWLERLLFEEIAPTLEGCVENPTGFANDVLDRFRNPAIEHKLGSIALNHADKVRVRLVPTAHQFEAKFGKKPPILSQLVEPYLN